MKRDIRPQLAPDDVNPPTRLTRASVMDRLMHRTALLPTGCWEWRGYRNHKGYGYISTSGRVLRSVHRVAYEHFIGDIPSQLEIDHLCRNRACVNPDHLEAVTHRENIRRKPLPPTCPQGHEFTPENTYRNAGKRRCKACARARAKTQRDRKARS